MLQVFFDGSGITIFQFRGGSECEYLIIAGCDFESSFSASELRQQFPNATNVIHSLPGKNAHEQLFKHALLYSSRDVKTLYDMPDRFTVGEFSKKWQTKKIRPYVAELFRHNERVPYKVQTAGRELLENDESGGSQKGIARKE